MQYEKDILTIRGVRSGDPRRSKAFATRYEQSQDAPDYLSPATSIMAQASALGAAALERAKRTGGDIELEPRTGMTRCPNLIPLKAGTLKLTSVWTGDRASGPGRCRRGVPLKRLSRADTFGVPAFRFDNVDIVGFRIDLEAIVNVTRTSSTG